MNTDKIMSETDIKKILQEQQKALEHLKAVAKESERIKPVIEDLNKLNEALLQKWNNGLKAATENIVNWSKKIGEIKSTLLNHANAFIQQAGSNAKTQLLLLGAKFSEFSIKAKNSINQLAENGKKIFFKFINNAIHDFKKLPGKLMQAGKEGFQGLKNIALNTLNWISRNYSLIWGKLKEVFTFALETAQKFNFGRKLAQDINATAQEVLFLESAANRTGSSTEKMRESLKGLSQAARDSLNDISSNENKFKALGIELTDCNGNIRNTTSLLTEVGEKIRGMNRQKQLEILSGLGIDSSLIPLITDDLKKFAEEYTTLNESIGLDIDEALEESKRFEESQNNLLKPINAAKDSLGVELMKPLRESMDKLSYFLKDHMPAIKVGISMIAGALSIVLDLIGIIILMFKVLGETIGIVAAWCVMAFVDAWDGLVGLWSGVTNFFSTIFNDVVDVIKNIFSGLFDWMSEKLEWIANAFTGIFETMGGFIDGVGDAIGGAADTVAGWGEGAIGAVSNTWNQLRGNNNAALTPSPSAAAAIQNNSRGWTQSNNQETTVNVYGANDPNATATAVGGAIRRANNDMLNRYGGVIAS